MNNLATARENTQINDQTNNPWAEGITTMKPVEEYIRWMLASEGWIAGEIDVFYDKLQGFWRWECDIERA